MNKRASISDRKKLIRLGELFSGPGGLALGALTAVGDRDTGLPRIVHAWANDYDRDSCNTYVRNLCADSPKSVLCGDVRKIDIINLPPIDAFAYGFPCNDFSVVGEQKGMRGNFGPLYTYGVKVLDHFKPLFFVAENVSGITSANSGEAFKRILHDLESAGDGYRLTIHRYHAEDYGVPQTRHRMIIVGFDVKSSLTFRVPRPTTLGHPVTSRQALERPPIPTDASNNEYTRQSAKVVARLKHTQPGKNAWNSDLPAHLRLNVKATKLSHIYRRLDPDKPSYTITGSGGGGTHGYHWTEPRALTNRERARIQTFPDSYVFEGSKESVRKQIGMAVPPLLVKVIFRAILQTIAGINYAAITANWQNDPDLFE